MDYYESTRPDVDDSGLSGGVSFMLGGQIAVATYTKPTYTLELGKTSTQETPTIVTLDICVDGVPKRIDVYANGDPY